jgi:hypothetical protein
MDQTEIIILVWLFSVVSCGFLGRLVGNAKNAGNLGAVLGALFGHLGVIVAFALDNRPKCPNCMGRIELSATVCQYCREPLKREAVVHSQIAPLEKYLACQIQKIVSPTEKNTITTFRCQRQFADLEKFQRITQDRGRICRDGRWCRETPKG